MRVWIFCSISRASTDLWLPLNYICYFIHQTALHFDSTQSFLVSNKRIPWFCQSYRNVWNVIWGMRCEIQLHMVNVINIFNVLMRLDFTSTCLCTCAHCIRSHHIFVRLSYLYNFFINWECIISAWIGFRLMTLSISCVPLDKFRYCYLLREQIT